MENREWLKSLSDRALAEEIYYGRMLAEGGRHREHYTRDLREAEDELRSRQSRPTQAEGEK